MNMSYARRRPCITQLLLYRPLLLFQRGYVNHEAVFHVVLQQAVVGLVDLVGSDYLDISGDVVLATKVEHLLCFADATDD